MGYFSVIVVSVFLPSDALSQCLPSYWGFSFFGHGVSLHGCSSKAQPLLLALNVGNLLTATATDLGRGVSPLSRYLRRPWCWERLKTGGEGDNRGWDGWMASPTQWRWVWVNSRSWWWTGTPGMLQSMGLQSWTWLSDWTELNWWDQMLY